MKNIAWHHRLGYELGCLKYNKKIQNKNSLKEIMDDINFELNANSSRNPVNQKNLGKIAALKKLYRTKNLYKHGKQRLLHRELDVVHIVRSMRTMQNFVTNFLNADQRQLIEY